MTPGITSSVSRSSDRRSMSSAPESSFPQCTTSSLSARNTTWCFRRVISRRESRSRSSRKRRRRRFSRSGARMLTTIQSQCQWTIKRSGTPWSVHRACLHRCVPWAQFTGGAIQALARCDRRADRERHTSRRSGELDLGQRHGRRPHWIPAEGFAAFVKRLRELGMTDAGLDRMGRRNPAALLGLP